MLSRIPFILFFLSLWATACRGQSDTLGPIGKNLYKHISYLASDKLGGRLTGTKGEKQAAIYIAKEFKKIGLKPKGTKGWEQPFDFPLPMKYGERNVFKWVYSPLGLHPTPDILSKKLQLEKEYYPLPYSKEGSFDQKVICNVGYGIRAPQKGHNDFANADTQRYNGQFLLINLDLPDGNTPHSKFDDYRGWQVRLDAVRRYHPAGIIFYGGESKLNLEAFRRFNVIKQDSLYLFYVTDSLTINRLGKYKARLPEFENGQQIRRPIAGSAQISGTVSFQHPRTTGRNVIGYLDNGKPLTVVIGAHYDHLGHAEMGHSLSKDAKEIHNGADDNASGAAALIELARLLKNDGPRDVNYLFIAFSGEELGLLGSSYFTKHPTIPLESISYMFNMDMVGRLNRKKPELGVNGVGTSPAWDSSLKRVQPTYFTVKTSQSGMGPSDHSSFYLKNIPVLHFFSGFHPDYHKPTDDIDKINFPGAEAIVQYIYGLLKDNSAHPKFAFQKTKEDSATKTPAFKVTLGIIPDYFYEGGGVRAEGVSKDRPAEKAGLQSGDVIIQIGTYPTGDINAYMRALSKFKKGDKTEVKIRRGNSELTLPLQF